MPSRWWLFRSRHSLIAYWPHGALQPCHIDTLAGYIADFHQQADMADSRRAYTVVRKLFINRSKRILGRYASMSKIPRRYIRLLEVESWGLNVFKALHPIFGQRKSAGFVRECHGDLHLRNIAWVDDAPLVFDCIEFSPNLRWIDVMSDIAFLVMDLQDRKQPAWRSAFSIDYLQRTGDYAGLGVLRFYQVYRALVRAKIDAIRAHQAGIS